MCFSRETHHSSNSCHSPLCAPLVNPEITAGFCQCNDTVLTVSHIQDLREGTP